MRPLPGIPTGRHEHASHTSPSCDKEMTMVAYLDVLTDQMRSDVSRSNRRALVIAAVPSLGVPSWNDRRVSPSRHAYHPLAIVTRRAISRCAVAPRMCVSASTSEACRRWTADCGTTSRHGRDAFPQRLSKRPREMVPIRPFGMWHRRSARLAWSLGTVRARHMWDAACLRCLCRHAVASVGPHREADLSRRIREQVRPAREGYR